MLGILYPNFIMAQDLPTPEQYFGFKMGADRKLAHWDDLVKYYNKLGDASPRMKVVNMGKTTLGNPFLALYISSPENLAKLEDFAANLPYYVDGIVLKVNDLESQEELGHTGDDAVNPPRCALAWKFKEEEATAEIAHLEWKASRTGRVVPTAVFVQSVNLADTDVTRATVNNYGWASNLGIGAGTKVKVKKAGKIIPNVCGVVSDAVDDIGAPTNCPVCDSKLNLHTSDSGNKDLLCQNRNCGAKQVHSWIFFLQNLGAKGLGTSAIDARSSSLTRRCAKSSASRCFCRTSTF